MKKYAFLTCDDLSEFVDDDKYAHDAFKEIMPDDELVVLPWSDKNVNWSDFDYAVIRTTWDYTKHLEEFLSVLTEIEESGCRLLNPKSIVEWNCRKTYLNDLKEEGVDIIDSIFLADEDLASFKDKIFNWPLVKLVLKPVVGASAYDIEIMSKEEMINRFEDIKANGEWFVQPFIEEVTEGELSYFFFNNEFSHAVKKVPKKGDFRVQEEYGSDISLHKPSESEISRAKDVIKNLGQNLLYSRIDMLNTKDGFKLIELELVEPSLYFRTDPQSADRFIKSLKNF